MTQQQEQEIGPWLALFHLSLPLKLSHSLLRYYGSPEALFGATDTELERLGITVAALDKIRSYRGGHLRRKVTTQIKKSLSWAQQCDHHLVTFNDSRYPVLLKQIAAPPLLLFIKGNPELLVSPQIAVVGSRHTSAVGADTAKLLARGLARQGLTVTSGLALGIDGAAHLGALSVQGKTIAVMATGADRLYPRRHQALAQQIVEQGALVTEFPLGSAPKPSCFPQRNRIISGLSLGVLVVEAALPSGSLITARCALEQNREVFAVPGSIHSATSRGCHALLRQGAKLVESVDDILEELAPQLPCCSGDAVPVPDSDRSRIMPEQARQILALIGYDPVPIEVITERTKLPVAETSQILMWLELDSHIKNVPGGFVRSLPQV